MSIFPPIRSYDENRSIQVLNDNFETCSEFVYFQSKRKCILGYTGLEMILRMIFSSPELIVWAGIRPSVNIFRSHEADCYQISHIASIGLGDE